MTAVNPITQFQKANDGKIKSDLAQVQRALESYYEDNGRYPASVDNRIQTIANPNEGNEWGNPWTPYMEFLPKSPGYPARTYIYFVPETGQSYFLYANLERGTFDEKACNNGEVCESIVTNGITNGCGGEKGCNYGVTSPNVNP